MAAKQCTCRHVTGMCNRLVSADDIIGESTCFGGGGDFCHNRRYFLRFENILEFTVSPQ